jgi:endonuclease YncB( thermonuclease family)
MSMTPGRQYLLHRIWRRFSRAGIALLPLSSLLDHAGAFGYRGNDWTRFDRRTCTVSRVIDHQSLECDGAVVRLLGVRAGAEHASSDAQENLEGRQVTLRLDVPQTRDGSGDLLAYVYLTPADCWNVDVIRDGSADADRRSNCSLLPALVAAETERNQAIRRLERKTRS